MARFLPVTPAKAGVEMAGSDVGSRNAAFIQSAQGLDLDPGLRRDDRGF